MASPPTWPCRRPLVLQLIIFSCVLLETVSGYDYHHQPSPAFDFEDGVSHRLRSRVENLPVGSKAAAVPLAATQPLWASARSPPAVAREAPLQAPAQERHASVEKNFNYEAAAGEVISAAAEESSVRPSDFAARQPGGQSENIENDVNTSENRDKTETTDRSEPVTQDAVENGGFQLSALNRDVSPLGLFFSPRPVLFDPVLYDRPLCRTPDGSQGVCHMNQMSCRLRGGAFSHMCSGGNGVCCVFQHSCSAFTRERVSYYRNPNFPYNNTGNLVCNYKAIIQPKVCAIRVDILNYTSPITPRCSEVQLSFFVGNHTRSIPDCGILTGKSVVFEGLKASRDKEVVISHVLGGEEPYKFAMRITQILCSSIKPLPVESACGRRNVGKVRHKRSENAGTDLWMSYESDSDAPFELDLKDNPTSDDQLTRILGGKEARLNEWPWQVGLFKRKTLKKRGKASFFCGATLINKEYILTAAHCISRFKDFNHTDVREHIIAVIGDHHLGIFNESKQVFRRIKRIIIHPLYDPTRNRNDIALMRFSKPVSYSGAIGPACLPSYPRNLTGQDLHVSGWGVTSFNGTVRGPTSAVLKTVAVKGLNREYCDEKWAKFDSDSTVYRDLPHLNEKQGCFANTPGTPCFGDSGGPVTLKETNGRFTVVGVISFGPPICKVGGPFPVIYTRVASFLDWINVAILDIF